MQIAALLPRLHTVDKYSGPSRYSVLRLQFIHTTYPYNSGFSQTIENDDLWRM